MKPISNRLGLLEQANPDDERRVFRITSFGQGTDEIDAFLKSSGVELADNDLLVKRCIVAPAGQEKTTQLPLRLG